MFTIESNYTIKSKGILSFDNTNFLYNLYLPIIGYKSTFVYMLLMNEYKSKNRKNSISYLLNKSNLTTSDFLLSRKTLESIGLLNTYEKNDDYIFILSSVLLPNDFFSNTILKGLFVNKVGQKRALEIMESYEVDDDYKDFKDVSATVNESFVVDEKDKTDLNCGELITNNINEIKDNFDEENLLKYVEEKSAIDLTCLTNDEIVAIHKLGSLYGFNEKIMGQILIDSYRDEKPIGSKIDLTYCKNRCKKEVRYFKPKAKKKDIFTISSTTDEASLINYYETNSPRDFLKEKQNGVEPVSSDLDIILFLSENMNLSNGVINVILEYTIKNLNGQINRKYIEKIAATLTRKGVKSALDAYDLLFNSHNKSSEKTEKNDEDDDVIGYDLDKVDI